MCRTLGRRPLGVMPTLAAAGIFGLMSVSASAQVPPLDSQRVASGLSAPIFAGAPPGDTSRLFIAEQGSGSTANIRILNLAGNTLNTTPFLTVGGLSTGGERGLLGLAFHPSYATNGLFYVNVTHTAVNTEIREYMRSGDPNVATATPVRTLLTIPQPQANHNGGWLGFSPRPGDAGNLYITTGDGGAGNDQASGHIEPGGNAQNTSALLGKVLRINVDRDDFPADAAKNYGIPANNPFNGTNGAQEVFAYGLRNPFRASFDRTAGHMYIGDVGQDTREEVDFQSAARPGGGDNFQWRLREGTIATPSGNPVVGGAEPANSTGPIDDYPRSVGSTITGGYVYRGSDIPGLQGAYLYGDFGSSRLFLLRHDGNAVTLGRTEITADLAPGGGLSINNPSSFGEDGRGELYIVDYGGEVFRITPEPAASGLLLLGGAAAVLRRRRAARAI